MGSTLWAALGQRFAKTPGTSSFAGPGPWFEATVAPRDPALVRDYIRHVGGDPNTYYGTVPPHLFPQWGVPLAARTIRSVRYPLVKILNGGCRLEMQRPLPIGEPLRVRARLEGIDDDGHRAVIHQRVITETDSAPDALTSHIYAIVPLRASKRAPGEKKEPPRVPDGATEIDRWRLPGNAGLAFAMLTGDFNPVHWIPPYARMFGFKSTILHGFSTLARAMEGVVRARAGGDPDKVATFDVKFTRPLVLPADVRLFVEGDGVFVGGAPGARAYLTGTMTMRASEGSDGEQSR
jgi:acyl dehydratase